MVVVRRVPVPSRGDRASGALVSAVRPLMSRRGTSPPPRHRTHRSVLRRSHHAPALAEGEPPSSTKQQPVLTTKRNSSMARSRIADARRSGRRFWRVSVAQRGYATPAEPPERCGLPACSRIREQAGQSVRYPVRVSSDPTAPHARDDRGEWRAHTVVYTIIAMPTTRQ
jgi:hypothetical protein